MTQPDLNLLTTLDVLLTEASVTRAARRLHLSPSAMSRALARVRAATDDPLLVRAGRGLVLTPRAAAIREEVQRIAGEARAVLARETALDVARLERTFSVRTSDGFVEAFGADLIAEVRREAPGVRLHFLQKPDKDSAALREGRVDLETGVVEEGLGPELRVQSLFSDRLVLAVRKGRFLGEGVMTVAQYAAAEHVVVSRSGRAEDAVDGPYLPAGIDRNVVAFVSGFSAALALARGADLVATVPERHTAMLRQGMTTLSLAAPMQAFTVSMIWHPRMDADPAHRWLRERFREICGPRTPTR